MIDYFELTFCFQDELDVCINIFVDRKKLFDIKMNKIKLWCHNKCCPLSKITSIYIEPYLTSSTTLKWQAHFANFRSSVAFSRTKAGLCSKAAPKLSEWGTYHLYGRPHRRPVVTSAKALIDFPPVASWSAFSSPSRIMQLLLKYLYVIIYSLMFSAMANSSPQVEPQRIFGCGSP